MSENRLTECPECAGGITQIGDTWVCSACQWRTAVTVGNTLTEGDLTTIWRSLALSHPDLTISRGIHFSSWPDAASLERGIRALTDRKVRNRLPRVEHAIAALEDIEAVVRTNLLELWGTPPAALGEDAARRWERSYESGHQAIDVIDRLVRNVESFTAEWALEGRQPRLLWRSPWESPGEDLVRDLHHLAAKRELLQVTLTLLMEHVQP